MWREEDFPKPDVKTKSEQNPRGLSEDSQQTQTLRADYEEYKSCEQTRTDNHTLSVATATTLLFAISAPDETRQCTQ